MKIVYLHGLNSSCKIFNHIHSQLPEHDAIFIDYDTFRPIEESYATALSSIPTTEPVSIISHSLGGLIAYLIHLRDNDVKVDKLITLSTPFGGSEHAKLLRWFYPSVKILVDLSPKSKVMHEINQPSKKKCKTLSLISTHGSIPLISDANDGIVTIKSQHASPAKRKVEIDANHFEVVQDSKAVLEIKKFVFG